MKLSPYVDWVDGALDTEVTLAKAIKDNLPLGLLAIFQDPDFKGSALVELSDTRLIRTPSAKEISRNYPWLLPVVQLWPSKARVAITGFVLNSTHSTTIATLVFASRELFVRAKPSCRFLLPTCSRILF